MARIIELSANNEPPQGADWVLVTSEGCNGQGQMEEHEMGATFFAYERDPDFAEAIDQAVAWADFHGIGAVYVQRTHSVV